MNKATTSARLTIAIPTWNRHERLREVAASLIPQLSLDCCLLIVDNASDEPVAPMVAALAGTLFGDEVQVIRKFLLPGN
jgi:GT2 family glycosyltransferase